MSESDVRCTNCHDRPIGCLECQCTKSTLPPPTGPRMTVQGQKIHPFKEDTTGRDRNCQTCGATYHCPRCGGPCSMYGHYSATRQWECDPTIGSE